MASLAVIDVRLQEPVCRRLKETGVTTVGFSKRWDIHLPPCLEWPSHRDPTIPWPDYGDREYPILTLEKVCAGGYIVKVYEMPAQRPSRQYQLLEVPFTGHRQGGSQFVTLKAGDTISVCRFRRNRDPMVLRATTIFWPVCQLQIREETEEEKRIKKDKEKENSTEKSGEGDEEPDDRSPIERLPEEVKRRIFRRLDFETLTSVLPAVSRDFFAVSRRLADAPAGSRLWVPSGVPSFHRFAALLCSLGVPLGLGERLESLELAEERGTRPSGPILSLDCAGFFELFPNLRKLVLGKGYLRFTNVSRRPFASSLRDLSIHWSCLNSFPGPFPFVSFTSVHTLVIVSETEGFSHNTGVFHENNLPGIAALGQLRTLTLAWCSLVPSSDWLTFFTEMVGDLRVLRVPGCHGIGSPVVIKIAHKFPNIELFEASSVRTVADAAVFSVVRRCRSLRTLIVTHMQEVRGVGWLDAPPSRLRVVATGSGCAMRLPQGMRGGEEDEMNTPGEWKTLM